jgi:hypothetical protein
MEGHNNRIIPSLPVPITSAGRRGGFHSTFSSPLRPARDLPKVAQYSHLILVFACLFSDQFYDFAFPSAGCEMEE